MGQNHFGGIKLKKIRQSIIGLFIGLAALYYTLRNVSVEELVNSLKNAELVYIFPGLVIITLSYVTRAYRCRFCFVPSNRFL